MLILSLVLVVILAVVVLAIASFGSTGLRTSRVTTERTASNSVASAGVNWFIEELAAKRVAPTDPMWCGDPGVTQSVPAGVLPESGASVSVTCETRPKIDSHPTVRLSATGFTSAGVRRDIVAVVQVPSMERTTQVYSWTAD